MLWSRDNIQYLEASLLLLARQAPKESKQATEARDNTTNGGEEAPGY